MASALTPSASPFLDPGPVTRPDALAIVQLSRDQFQPLYLHDAGGGAVDGYAEGAVLNTRFGSFPHSTLIGVPWGSQVRASVVDTGSRGRKRKRPSGDETPETPGKTPDAAAAAAMSAPGTPSAAAAAAASVRPPTAASGFIHILPPTPELWTLSLPHRTQVVYTADYSYILHRLRAQPGTRLIEAGAGSGSFTHAAARAVHGTPNTAPGRRGRVFSFEFHNERYRTMQAELASHGLDRDGLVTLTNRDVYGHGFLLDDGSSPEADAVFLDLPAPWRALEHLSRRVTAATAATNGDADADVADDAGDANEGALPPPPPVSPLNPCRSVYLCTFSPCIEQVTRTVSVLRRLGWVGIDMVEIANRKILVYRDRPEPLSGKGTPPAPRDVLESVSRLKAIEARTREHSKQYWEARAAAESGGPSGNDDAMDVDSESKRAGAAEKEDDGDDGDEDDNAADYDAKTKPPTATPPPTATNPWMEGQLTTRVEPEVKTHTSYLVFAVLPREWTDADEAGAAARWPCGNEKGVIGAVKRDLRKEQKRQQLAGGHKKEKKQM